MAEATWRVLCERGIEGASLRAIARELGCSTGVLVHYFDDKEDLLAYAMALAFDRLRERLRRAAEGREPLEALRAMALAALPLDADSVLRWRVWLVFLARSASEGAFVTRSRESAELIRLEVERILKSGVADGSIELHQEVGDVAERLLSRIDGLSLRARFDPRRYSRARLRSLADEMIGELAPSPASAPKRVVRR